jgi:hypothetical protein
MFLVWMLWEVWGVLFAQKVMHACQNLSGNMKYTCAHDVERRSSTSSSLVTESADPLWRPVLLKLLVSGMLSSSKIPQGACKFTMNQQGPSRPSS